MLSADNPFKKKVKNVTFDSQEKIDSGIFDFPEYILVLKINISSLKELKCSKMSGLQCEMKLILGVSCEQKVSINGV